MKRTSIGSKNLKNDLECEIWEQENVKIDKEGRAFYVVRNDVGLEKK
jgi:hypothetical protein